MDIIGEYRHDLGGKWNELAATRHDLGGKRIPVCDIFMKSL